MITLLATKIKTVSTLFKKNKKTLELHDSKVLQLTLQI